jgi:polysaccharide export outer membrane protein
MKGVTAVLMATALWGAGGCAGTGPGLAARVPRYRPVETRQVVRAAAVATWEAGTESFEQQMAEYNRSRVLRSGDRLEVSLRAIPQPELLRVAVDEEGRINLPLIGAIPVAGKTTAEAQKLIESAYIEGQIYKIITVIIVPPESEYFVTGEVLRPGPYPLTRAITVLQAISAAGKFTEFAEPTKIRIRRGRQSFVVNAKKIQRGDEPDVVVLPGDVIDVPRGWY